MIPSGPVRLRSIKELLRHIRKSGAASGLNAFQYKKCIIKFNQIVICCTGIHTLGTVVLQHSLNIQTASGNNPVLSVFIAAVCEGGSILYHTVFLISNGMINNTRLFQFQGQGSAVIVCFHLIFLIALSALSCHLQTAVLYIQVKRSCSVFIYNILAVLVIKRLNDPELSCRKTGILNIPVIFYGIRIIINIICLITVTICIRQFFQINFIIAYLHRNSIPCL